MDFSVLGKVNISQQLDSAYLRQRINQNEEVDKNRHILRRLIVCIKFCDTSTSDNLGIYVGLVNFTAEIDALLAIHYERFASVQRYIKNYSERIIRSSQILTRVLTFFPPGKQGEWILCTKMEVCFLCPPSFNAHEAPLGIIILLKAAYQESDRGRYMS
nr:unnamed protein product [Callosobruchus analis]